MNRCCFQIVSKFAPLEMRFVNLYGFKVTIPFKVTLTSYEEYLHFCRTCRMFSITVNEVRIYLKSMWWHEPHHVYDWFPACVKTLVIHETVFAQDLFQFKNLSIETLVLEKSWAKIVLPKTLVYLNVGPDFNGDIYFGTAINLKKLYINCTLDYQHIQDLPDSICEISITDQLTAKIMRWPSGLSKLILNCDIRDKRGILDTMSLHDPLSKTVVVCLKSV